jgi:CBS-domain-containing membrane protein
MNEFKVIETTCPTASKETKTPWPESASELYRLSDRRLSAELVPNFTDRGCHVVSVTDPSGRILGFLDRSRYFSIK